MTSTMIRVKSETLHEIEEIIGGSYSSESWNESLIRLTEKAKMSEVLAGLLVLERMPGDKRADVNARNKAMVAALLGYHIKWTKS